MAEAKKSEASKEDSRFPKGSRFWRSRHSGLTVMVGEDASVRFSPHAIVDGMGDTQKVGLLVTDDEAANTRLEDLSVSGDIVEMSQKDFEEVTKRAEPLGFVVG